MKNNASNLTLEVRLAPAARARLMVMDRLFQLYLHDFSAFVDLEINQHGRFEYPPLDTYWSDPLKEPFFIEVDDKTAGFVLIRKDVGGDEDGQKGLFDVSEFFVLRGYRRQGVGKKSAYQLWDRYPGPWRVRVIQENRPAVNFWSTIIEAYSAGDFRCEKTTLGEYHWLVFTFSSLKGRD